MHKFKLKKDGKVVGYLSIENGEVRVNGALVDPNIAISFDTTDPLVCLDKNEEEVYADDPIYYQGKNYPKGFSWNESSLAWDLHDGYFHTHYGATGTGGEDDYFDIALIKE